MGGFSQIKGNPLGTVMNADNVSFDGTPRGGVLTANGQLLIGSTALPHIRVGGISSPLGTIVVGYSSPNITLDVSGITPPGSSLLINVDSATAPGTNPVPPDGTGHITLEGGATYATGTRANPIRTNSLAANTVDLQIQLAGSNAAASTSNNFGVSQFDANHFTVTTGFVQLKGGGVNPALIGLIMDTGTSPVVPNGSGQITLTAATVAAGTNPIRTNGTGANTSSIQVQLSQALAATDATKVGLSNFDSTVFSVDANGFVTLLGGSVPVPQKFNVDANTAPGTDPVVASALGVVTVTGAQVATGTIGANVIRTNSLAVNTYTIEIQRSTTAASADSTKNGVSHFSSADFSVDANGFVTTHGRTLVWEQISANQALVKNTGYFCISPGGALSLSLPSTASSTIGDIIEVTLDGATSWTITQGASQQIRLSSTQTTSGAGGSLASTAAGDSIRMVYQATGKWNVVSAIGNITIV